MEKEYELSDISLIFNIDEENLINQNYCTNIDANVSKRHDVAKIHAPCVQTD